MHRLLVTLRDCYYSFSIFLCRVSLFDFVFCYIDAAVETHCISRVGIVSPLDKMLQLYSSLLFFLNHILAICLITDGQNFWWNSFLIKLVGRHVDFVCLILETDQCILSSSCLPLLLLRNFCFLSMNQSLCYSVFPGRTLFYWVRCMLLLLLLGAVYLLVSPCISLA